jgi:hypothetical protein
MALDQKALQKKRAKRELKRRQTKPASSGLPGALSAARVWANVGRAPIADIFVPSNLFELGIGTVWVSRSLPDGRYAVAGILVDVFCLGVKNALYKIVDAAEYPTVLARIRGNPTESARPGIRAVRASWSRRHWPMPRTSASSRTQITGLPG